MHKTTPYPPRKTPSRLLRLETHHIVDDVRRERKAAIATVAGRSIAAVVAAAAACMDG